jgi:hypothetical protein
MTTNKTPWKYFNTTTDTLYYSDEQAEAAYANHRANRQHVCIVDRDYNEVYCNRGDH